MVAKNIQKTSNRPSKEWIYKERQKLTSSLRFFIINRDNYRCQICGLSPLTDDRVRLENSAQKRSFAPAQQSSPAF